MDWVQAQGKSTVAFIMIDFKYLALFKVHEINPENVRARNDL